jgi:CubicO group peptidase (beta-lactamase class C family)
MSMSGSVATAAAAVTQLLQEGVEAGVFPGAVAAVGQLLGEKPVALVVAAGKLAAGEGPAGTDTVYDLASLTKPVVASVALRLTQAGCIDLQRPVSAWLPEIEGSVGGAAPLELLLSHRAGLSPWGSLFRDAPDAPGAPATRAYFVREAAQRAAPTPSAPGSVYSDLGYLIAGEVLERATGLRLDALVEREVAAPLALGGQLFYAAALADDERVLLRERAAPTELCDWRARVVRGEVHDENSAAHGGISGHAGLFGRARAVLALGLAWIAAWEGRSSWLDQALVRWALRPRPGGGHVVGWDTKSAEGSSAGSILSAQAFGHLGFTGTSLWCDPVRQRAIVLLSNRVHPSRDNIAIRAFRPRFHDLAAQLALT